MRTVQGIATDAKRLGISLSPGQLDSFHAYTKELLDWNRRINLTAITEPFQVEKLHFLDSLTVSLALSAQVKSSGSMCDVGSGAGFPGIPLKIAFPGIKLTVVDSATKRTGFLERLVSVLGLADVEVINGRAEDLGRRSEFRERFDVVVSRAVAETRVLMEYTLPLCRVGGLVIMQKKGDVQEEVERASGGLRELGGGRLKMVEVPEDVLEGQRKLAVVKKTSNTPSGYPRRTGIPAKRPL